MKQERRLRHCFQALALYPTLRGRLGPRRGRGCGRQASSKPATTGASERLTQPRPRDGQMAWAIPMEFFSSGPTRLGQEAAQEWSWILGLGSGRRRNCAVRTHPDVPVAAAPCVRARWFESGGIWMDDAELKPSSSQLGSNADRRVGRR